MAKLTRSNSLSAFAEGKPVFSAGTARFSIGITGQEGVTYHVHPDGCRGTALCGVRRRAYVKRDLTDPVVVLIAPECTSQHASGWEGAAHRKSRPPPFGSAEVMGGRQPSLLDFPRRIVGNVDGERSRRLASWCVLGYAGE